MKQWLVNINDGEDPEAILSELGARLQGRARLTVITADAASGRQGDSAINVRANDRYEEVEKVINEVIGGRGSIDGRETE